MRKTYCIFFASVNNLETSWLQQDTQSSLQEQKLERMSQSGGSVRAGRLVGEQKGVWKQLGKLLWPKFAKAYIESVLAPAVPQSEEDFRAFERLSDAAQDLERGLVQEG